MSTPTIERVFHRGWVFVGHDSEVPRPGDLVTRHIGTGPVVLVRGKDGALAVLVNRCAHRGTQVCMAERGSTLTFTCPYHGWTYDLGGEPLGAPYPGGYASFDKSQHGLTRAPRVASYRGFAFVSLSPTGITLAEHLLERGLNRDYVDGNGRTVSYVTDETTNRGFWRLYRTVMVEG